MATLKELLRAESLVGGARGAALDTSTYTSITPPAKGSSVDYIAPANGELHVTGEYKTTDTWNSLWTLTNGAAQIGSALEGATGWIAFKTRLKKGDRVTVGNSGETIVATVSFFRAIGGGYKRYLPSLSCNRFGGALWLRLKTTSETLRRLGVACFFFAAATSSLIEKSSKERCDETDERGHCAHQHDGLPDDGVLLLLCGHIPAG